MTIEITHTPAEGTLVAGTARGDGASTILYERGFRWGRSIGCWYRPSSRDRAPDFWRINQTADALRAAGFEVSVSVDAGPRDQDQAEADRAERMEARADALKAKAERHGAEATARFDSMQRRMDAIPFGQPILVGHHSEGRHRREIDRIDRDLEAGVEAHTTAKEAARRAELAANHMERRESAITAGNRIKRLEAEIRDTGRRLTPCPTSGRRTKPEAEGWTITCPNCHFHVTIVGGVVPEHGAATGDYRAQLEANLAHAEVQLEHWRGVRVAQAESGAVKVFGPHNVKKGDRVCRRGRDWHEVVRVNRQSVSVPSLAGGSWTDTIPYHKITEVRSALR